MKNIELLSLEKYNDAARYKLIEEGIYQDLSDTDDTNHRMAISFDLEEGEDDQYPLEDILDKFNLYVSDFIEYEDRAGDHIKIELAGTPEDIRDSKEIIGRRAYNRDLVKDGETYVELVIE